MGGERRRLMDEVEILTKLNHVCEPSSITGQLLIVVAKYCEHEKSISLRR